jgi:S1-C subfamily serine protease
LHQYEDAVPVLRRCTSLYPDFAGCWLELGEALVGLDDLDGAEDAYKKCVATGAYDTVSADAINGAKEELAAVQRLIKLKARLAEAAKAATTQAIPESPAESFGTGFFVTKQGHILTNNHVVEGCKTITSGDGKPLTIVSRNARSDLALLKSGALAVSFAVFRAGPSPKPGDAVVAFGFPLHGLLSSEGNVSSGIISATTGLRNDVRFIQISAPVQPGNSGGPLFDSSGHVIGLVVAKLDAVRVAQLTGDVPQNVNFAVHWTEVRAFLDEEGIAYSREPSVRVKPTADIAANAQKISVAIHCVE